MCVSGRGRVLSCLCFVGRGCVWGCAQAGVIMLCVGCVGLCMGGGVCVGCVCVCVLCVFFFFQTSK